MSNNLVFSKKSWLLNLGFKSYIYYNLFTLLRPSLMKIQYDQQNPYSNKMMLALEIGDIVCDYVLNP